MYFYLLLIRKLNREGHLLNHNSANLPFMYFVVVEFTYSLAFQALLDWRGSTWVWRMQ